jgi:arylsulfatase A-like enzyme
MYFFSEKFGFSYLNARRPFSFVIAMVMILVAGSIDAKGSPNFIVILLDDFGWSSMSQSMDKNRPEAKSDYYRTPNIDNLINRGMRFSNGYASSPVCSPTRYSIQFGKSPASLRRTRGLGKNEVDHSQIAIPQVLKAIDSEYRTAHIGKWHIDADPRRYEYDVHDGQTGNKTAGFDNNDRSRQWSGYSEDDPKRVNTITSKAIKFIRDSVEREQPFFLQLSHYAVHSNIVYSESSYNEVGTWTKGQLHSNQAYAAMVRDMDLSIGNLLDVYDDLDLRSNTYVILVSDNGGMPVLPQQVNRGIPYKPGLNSPLLRGKWDLMEGGIRIPFAVFGPNISQSSQSDEPVVTHDILPTLADLSGSVGEVGEDIEGVSLVPLLRQTDIKVDRAFDSLVFHYPHYNLVGMSEPHSAIRSGDYKLIDFPVSDRQLLFNINKDIGESNDLSTQRADLVSLLKKKMEVYLSEVGAERPEEAYNWETTGKSGNVRTKFFRRYSDDFDKK